MKLEEIIASRLKEAREAAGMSQQALGVAVGIEEETARVRIHQYEQLKHAPPFAALERIAHVLDKPVAWFVSKTDEQELILNLTKLPLTRREKIISELSDYIKAQLYL